MTHFPLSLSSTLHSHSPLSTLPSPTPPIMMHMVQSRLACLLLVVAILALCTIHVTSFIISPIQCRPTLVLVGNSAPQFPSIRTSLRNKLRDEIEDAAQRRAYEKRAQGGGTGSAVGGAVIGGLLGGPFGEHLKFLRTLFANRHLN